MNPTLAPRISLSTSGKASSINSTSGYASVVGSGLFSTNHPSSPISITSSNTLSGISSSLPEKFSPQIPSSSILKQPMSLAKSALKVASAHNPTPATISVKSSQKTAPVTSSQIPLHPTHPNTSTYKSSTSHQHHSHLPSENKRVPLGSIPFGPGDSTQSTRSHSISVPSTATPVTDTSTQNVWNNFAHQNKAFADQLSSNTMNISEGAKVSSDDNDALYYTPMTEMPPNFSSFTQITTFTTTTYSTNSDTLSSSQLSAQNQQSYATNAQNSSKPNR